MSSVQREDDVEAHDPTRSGSPLRPGAGARLSQNEIEQLCLKAARGAGMTWGLAEEAGFAAAWLAARGLDGPGALLAQLDAAGDRPWREICPLVAPDGFRAVAGGCLCPIALGAALCDHAGLPETAMQGAALRLGPVGHPVLLLPFLSGLARARGATLRFDWSEGRVLLTADGRMSGDAEALGQVTALEATLSISAEADGSPQPAVERRLIPQETLSRLTDLAMRITVPASETSRAGAGALAGDND